ncbi:MAG: hypothetical protein HC861_03025, partial [Rhodospirillaceae bacterium]|nr:hypothetical protein [Rhodospirillaceae bacterium]
MQIGPEQGQLMALLAKLIAAMPHILPHLEGSEIADWVRAAADIGSVYPSVFSSLPPGLRLLDLVDRNNIYKLVRTAAFRSPHSAALLYQDLPATLGDVSEDLRGLLVRCLQTAA